MKSSTQMLVTLHFVHLFWSFISGGTAHQTKQKPLFMPFLRRQEGTVDIIIDLGWTNCYVESPHSNNSCKRRNTAFLADPRSNWSSTTIGDSDVVQTQPHQSTLHQNLFEFWLKQRALTVVINLWNWCGISVWCFHIPCWCWIWWHQIGIPTGAPEGAKMTVRHFNSNKCERFVIYACATGQQMSVAYCVIIRQRSLVLSLERERGAIAPPSNAW